MEHKIIVVGIGPGSPDYILPIASRHIGEAKVLVGSQRALDAFAPSNAKTKVIGKDIDGVLTFIEGYLISNDVVVMVSGDPGFYSLLVAINAKFSQEQIMVVPGISSMQLAFARIGQVWQDAVMISMHGRQAHDEDLNYRLHQKIGVLTDPKHNPQYIANTLIKHGWPLDGQVWLCADLSYEHENIIKLTLEEATQIDGFNHCVMVVKA